MGKETKKGNNVHKRNATNYLLYYYNVQTIILYVLVWSSVTLGCIQMHKAEVIRFKQSLIIYTEKSKWGQDGKQNHTSTRQCELKTQELKLINDETAECDDKTNE